MKRTLLDEADEVGAGAAKPVGTYKTCSFEVWGTGTFAVQIQAIGPSGTPRNLKVWDELNNAFLSGDITSAGFYSVNVPAFTKIRANVVSISPPGSTVSVEGGLSD